MPDAGLAANTFRAAEMRFGYGPRIEIEDGADIILDFRRQADVADVTAIQSAVGRANVDQSNAKRSADRASSAAQHDGSIDERRRAQNLSGPMRHDAQPGLPAEAANPGNGLRLRRKPRGEFLARHVPAGVQWVAHPPVGLRLQQVLAMLEMQHHPKRAVRIDRTNHLVSGG